jgi:hypothetical protein
VFVNGFWAGTPSAFGNNPVRPTKCSASRKKEKIEIESANEIRGWKK